MYQNQSNYDPPQTPIIPDPTLNNTSGGDQTGRVGGGMYEQRHVGCRRHDVQPSFGGIIASLAPQ